LSSSLPSLCLSQAKRDVMSDLAGRQQQVNPLELPAQINAAVSHHIYCLRKCRMSEFLI